MKPRSGEILFNQQPIHILRPEKIVEKGIIQVPEGRKLFSLMTVRENLDVGAHNPRAYPRRAETLKEVYKLLPRLAGTRKTAGHHPERRRAADGCHRQGDLMALPKILMMDEPSLGLAPVLIKEIFTTIRKIADQGTTVLLVEQDVPAFFEASRTAAMCWSTAALSWKVPARNSWIIPEDQEAYLGYSNRRKQSHERIFTVGSLMSISMPGNSASRRLPTIF